MSNRGYFTMKVLFLFDILEDLHLSRKSFSYLHDTRGAVIRDYTQNTKGYVKVGDSVQSHATLDSDLYLLLGGDRQHQELLQDFLTDHNNWINIGMNYTAFFEYENAILFNTDLMHYNVWIPSDD